MQLSTFSSKVFENLCIPRVFSKIICVQIVYKDLIPILYDFHNLQVENLKLCEYEEVLFNLNWSFNRLVTTSLCRRKKRNSQRA